MSNKNRLCQCPECGRKPAPGEPLCRFHMKNGCNIISPLSGFEPPYEPEAWNTDKSIQHSHNCFAYATNYFDKEKIQECRNSVGCNVGFHVPGKDKGHPGFRQKEKRQQNYMTCSDVVGRTIASLNGIPLNFTDPCPPESSKIAIVVDDKNDLHYYRQDSNGWWSHKPGGRPATNLDADGVRIYDPRRCNRTYLKEDPSDSALDYRHFCCYMAVPRNKAAEFIQLKGGKKRRTKTKRVKRQQSESL